VQQQVLERMLPQAEELAAADQTQLEAAKQRLDAACAELTAAQKAMDLISGMARSSSTLLATIREQLRRQQAAAGTVQDPCAAAVESASATTQEPVQLTVADAIRALLREQGEATYGEITAHIRQVRPDVNVKNTSPELRRLVKRGELVRPRVGSYRLNGCGSATDSS
jgi:hypothetical protein